MLEQAKAAEEAGFDGHASSDHFAPWFPDGQASSGWVHLAAAGQHTTGPLGTSVTPLVHHYHPGVVAQAFMSLEELYEARSGRGPPGSPPSTPTGCGRSATRRSSPASSRITARRAAAAR
jgi:hypothetical protein